MLELLCCHPLNGTSPLKQVEPTDKKNINIAYSLRAYHIVLFDVHPP